MSEIQVAVPVETPAPAPAPSPLRHLRAVFSPNAAVPGSVFRLVIVAEVVLLFAGWLALPSIFPSPAEVLASLNTLVTQQGLVPELWTSLVLNLEAIAITTALSLLLAYSTVLPVMRPVVTALTKGRFLGMIGLSFVFTMMAGGGHGLKLSMLVFGMGVFFLTSMADVVEQTPKEKLDYARTLRMSEWQVVREVVVLGNMDKALDILRQNAAIGWMMLSMVESYVRSEGGIGTVLLNQNKHFNLDAVFAILLVFLVVGLAQDYVLGVLKAWLTPHAYLTLERR